MSDFNTRDCINESFLLPMHTEGTQSVPIHKIAHGAEGSMAVVSGSDPLPCMDNGIIGAGNSTDTLLTSGSTFTGTAELNYHPDVQVYVKTDQVGTLYCEFSVDGTNWDTSLSFAYNPSRINPPHKFSKGNRYFRVRFVNGTDGDQTYLRLQTDYGAFRQLTAPINGTLAENYDATVTRPTDYMSEVAMGKRQGRAVWNKFGYNLNVPNSATEQILASWGGAFDPNTDIISTAQTFTIAYNNATDGLGTTGATQLIVSYLDENFLAQTAFHVLSNTGSDVTSFTGLGINRVVVYANGGAGWNVNNITITATTDGTTQAQVPALSSVTQQCIFHTQISHTFLADWLWFNCLKLSGAGGSPRVNIKGYSWSRVTETRYEVFNEDIDTSVENSIAIAPSQKFIVGGREVLYFTASSNTNNTAVKCRFSGIEERVV